MIYNNEHVILVGLVTTNVTNTMVTETVIRILDKVFLLTGTLVGPLQSKILRMLPFQNGLLCVAVSGGTLDHHTN